MVADPSRKPVTGPHPTCDGLLAARAIIAQSGSRAEGGRQGLRKRRAALIRPHTPDARGSGPAPPDHVAAQRDEDRRDAHDGGVGRGQTISLPSPKPQDQVRQKM
jgi:hypothetical protein